MFEEVEFPKKRWRPPRETKAKRELRGEKAQFTSKQQAQYTQLVATVESGKGLLVKVPWTPAVTYRQASTAWTGGFSGIDSAVRIRLLDKEGYAMETKRVDEMNVAIRLREEELRCSSLGCQINVVKWQREHPGVRLRRTDPCPHHATSGVLIPSKKKSTAA